MATLGNSKLVTKEMSYHSNMTELNHLGVALLATPDKMLGITDEIFSSSTYYSQNPLFAKLRGGKNTDITINGIEWEWELKDATVVPLVIVGNVLPASNQTPGKYKKSFNILASESLYVAGDVMSPGTSDKRFQVRIQEDPKRYGDGWLYKVRMNSDNDEDFIPLKFLKTNQKWGKLFSTYEEGAEQDGSVQFATTMGLSNRLSKFRKKYQITDYALTQVLAMKIPDSNGKSHMAWLGYAEVEFWKQWYQELELGFWYTRNTQTVKGATGRPVTQGAGIQQQLEDSHVERYTTLTANLIEEYLMDIFYSRTAPGKGRQIKGYSGEYGMRNFARAVEKLIDKGGFIRNVEAYQNGVKSEYHSNAKEFGYQVVKYNMFNGASLELIHNPLYDNRNINTEIDPITGYPVESQRITFLDFSGDDSMGSNIKMVKKAKSETFGYVEGNFGPTGVNTGKRAHSGDYFSMHVGKVCGAHIEDVTKCGELIFSRS